MRRLLATLALVSLLGGLAACGDDDDDDVAAGDDDTSEETTEETDPPYDDPAMSGNQLAFCDDWNEPDGDEILIEDVQTSIDLALATQSEMPIDVADAIDVAVQLASHVVDDDDGDGVASTEELQAALDATPDFAAASETIDAHCAAAESVSRNRQNGDG